MSVSLLLVVDLGAPRALAGAPFGGDDLGFVPPDKPTLACERAVATNVAKLIHAVTICHVKSADAGIKNKTFDETACESAGRAKYDHGNSKLTGCPACLDPGMVADGEVGRLDGIAAALVYCDATSGKPLADGDDSGFVPANRTAGKCQNLVTRRIASLATRLIKCHNTFATAALKSGTLDQASEDACESAALAKYTAYVGALRNCPACLTPVLATLGAGAVASLNVNGGDVYCGSPSGAFLDVFPRRATPRGCRPSRGPSDIES